MDKIDELAEESESHSSHSKKANSLAFLEDHPFSYKESASIQPESEDLNDVQVIFPNSQSQSSRLEGNPQFMQSLPTSNPDRIIEPKFTMGGASDFPRDTELSEMQLNGDVAQSMSLVRGSIRTTKDDEGRSAV